MKRSLFSAFACALKMGLELLLLPLKFERVRDPDRAPANSQDAPFVLVVVGETYRAHVYSLTRSTGNSVVDGRFSNEGLPGDKAWWPDGGVNPTFLAGRPCWGANGGYDCD